MTDDVLEPVYCLRCRSVLPTDVADVQLLCDACLVAERENSAAFASAHPDTGLGECPKCGSRNLVVTMYANPWKRTIETLLRIWMWGSMFFLRFGSQSDKYDEGEMKWRCKDCNYIW